MKSNSRKKAIVELSCGRPNHNSSCEFMSCYSLEISYKFWAKKIYTGFLEIQSQSTHKMNYILGLTHEKSTINFFQNWGSSTEIKVESNFFDFNGFTLNLSHIIWVILKWTEMKLYWYPWKWVTVGGKANGTRVFLEVTDTAGQEAFVAIRDHYITNGDGFLLVYAINDEQSFKQLDSIR